jgi:hypothetical protein
MFRAYFYKGTRPGMAGIYNRLVRARGDGKYSHVELSFGPVKGATGEWAASSSFEDKGTRFKMIDFSDANWDYIDLPQEWLDAAYLFMAEASRNNKGYDLLGNVHIALGFIPNSKDKFFCSEAIAAALKLDEPFRFEPNALYVVIKRMVELYNTK